MELFKGKLKTAALFSKTQNEAMRLITNEALYYIDVKTKEEHQVSEVFEYRTKGELQAQFNNRKKLFPDMSLVSGNAKPLMRTI